MELPAGDDGALWSARTVGPQRAVPFLSVNGKTISPEPPAKNSRGNSWVFLVMGDVEVSQLEVGLRKRLRQRVEQVGVVLGGWARFDVAFWSTSLYINISKSYRNFKIQTPAG